ncbi:IS66 family insertion sequence element accessory protein TnpB [Pseudomonas anatoliensis]|nr:IS66 family insertion sequence element accessory protein TnpB [Pseudomonas anatoliensis]
MYAKVDKLYLYPKPVDFRKSIDGLASLVELDIKVAVFDPVLFVFLNKPHNRVKILYWERNGFCVWLKPSNPYDSRHRPTSTM